MGEFLWGPIYRCGDSEDNQIIFPNGYSVDIIFGHSPDPYMGSMFDSEYRKFVLKDPEGNIISEITEENPHYIPDDVRKSFFGW